MGKIIISENVSIDGVFQDPTGEEGLGRGSWFTQITEEDRDEWAKFEFEEARAAEALLLGRKSYAWFVSRGWASRSGEWADRLRSLPKYVVTSSTLDCLDWENSTALTGDVIAEVAKLKQQVDGEIVVYGSSRLTHTLLAHDLVDELRLMTYPILVGAGKRFFGETSGLKPMRLLNVRFVGKSLAMLTFRPV